MSYLKRQRWNAAATKMASVQLVSQRKAFHNDEVIKTCPESQLLTKELMPVVVYSKSNVVLMDKLLLTVVWKTTSKNIFKKVVKSWIDNLQYNLLRWFTSDSGKNMCERPKETVAQFSL